MVRTVHVSHHSPTHPADVWLAAGSEPALCELWRDPVLLAVLRRDRLNIVQVQAQVSLVGRRLRRQG